MEGLTGMYAAKVVGPIFGSQTVELTGSVDNQVGARHFLVEIDHKPPYVRLVSLDEMASDGWKFFCTKLDFDAYLKQLEEDKQELDKLDF